MGFDITSKNEDIIYSKEIERFLRFLRNASQDNTVLKEDWNDCDSITQDILHSLELEKPTVCQRSKLSSLMSKTRKRRRIDKNTVRITDPIAHWVARNKSVINSLEELLGNVRKIEKSINTVHVYTYRSDAVKEIMCDEEDND